MVNYKMREKYNLLCLEMNFWEEDRVYNSGFELLVTFIQFKNKLQ